MSTEAQKVTISQVTDDGDFIKLILEGGKEISTKKEFLKGDQQQRLKEGAELTLIIKDDKYFSFPKGKGGNNSAPGKDYKYECKMAALTAAALTVQAIGEQVTSDNIIALARKYEDKYLTA